MQAGVETTGKAEADEAGDTLPDQAARRLAGTLGGAATDGDATTQRAGEPCFGGQAADDADGAEIGQKPNPGFRLPPAMRSR